MPNLLRIIAAIEPAANINFLLVDADPSVSPGVVAGIGSIALTKDTAALFVKTGAGDTAWAAGSATTGITGLMAKFVAAANVIGGIPVLHQIDIADASADTDLVLTHKTLIVDAWFHNTGIAAHASADTLQLKNGSTAITAATAKTATVEAVIRFLTFVAAQKTIAAGGTLRVTAVKSTNVAASVFVLGIRVA